MKIKKAKYFLASNSADGFVSYFDSCYDPAMGYTAYIIKGGPGTGKSSFIKKVIASAQSNNIAVEEIGCASDPNSLDGVIIPSIKTVFLDGTPPHAVEPRLPGVCETLLDFGAFWKGEALKSKAKEILSLTLKNKEFHRSAAQFIVKAGKVLEENITLSDNLIKNATEICEDITAKYLYEEESAPKEWFRFAGGITPYGLEYVTSPDCFEKQVLLGGSAGQNSEVIKQFKNNAIKRGYEVITLLNPILPSRIYDGVIIPKLSLFVGGFSKKITGEAAEYITEAAKCIYNAKQNHDELEKCYINAMDFDALNNFGSNIIKKLF